MLVEDNGGLSDEELIADLARGNTNRLGELYLRHGNNVLRFLKALLKDTTRFEVEDICHEVFLTVYEKASRYRETGKFRSWLLGIAAHKARSVERKQRWRRHLLMTRARDEALLTDKPASMPDEVLGRRQQIENGLARLTAEQRAVLVLRASLGFSGDEIAQALGISEDAVWSRLKRAHRILSAEAVAAK